jgi:glycosyltransferase involved in cell wall biosynthesis
MRSSSVEAPGPAPASKVGASPSGSAGRPVPARSVRRILYIEANEDGTVGGSHRALFDLVTGLDGAWLQPIVLFYQDNPFAAALREQGVEVRLYEEQRDRERAAYRGAGPLGKAWELAARVRRRMRFLRSLRIDLVHVNNSPRVGGEDWLPAARLLGIPCIAHVRGDARGEQRPLRRFLFRSFDQVIPVSGFLEAAMRRAGYPASRISQVFDGIALEAFRARVKRSPAEVREEIGVPPGKILAVMVGNIREWKGQHVVLQALAAMPAEQRDALFVAFAGAMTPEDHDFMRGLERTVAAGGLGPHVAFLGARDDIPDLLNAADIALHASIRREPFGLVVVEAMALGKPMVAANSGGPAEVITPESGVTHDPQHPEQLAAILTRLVADPELRASLSQGALERVNEFRLARCVAGVERVYERFLSGRAGEDGTGQADDRQRR